MKRAKGVSRRTGTSNWQWAIKPPEDLRDRYPTQWAYRCSLGTADLRAANDRAPSLEAVWRKRFSDQRQGISPEAPPPSLAGQAEQPDHRVTVSTPVAARQRPPKTLRDVFTLWKAAKLRTNDSVSACERSLSLFEQQSGTPPLQQITRAQGDAFRAHLLQQKLSSKTQHDRMTWLKSLLKYASRDLELIARNPWEGLDIDHRTESPRKPWSVEQLKTLAALPLFNAYELPKAWRAGQAAAYWIPILGLYTGARVGELCQLRPCDVDHDEFGAMIQINEEAEGSTVKSEAGLRTVPVHSELIRLGFLEYVAAMKTAGAVSLWPSLRLRAGKPGGYFSDWFRSLRQSCPIEVPDFHSLRHTVRTAMTEAGIAESVQDRITGHEVKGSTGTKVYAHPRAILRAAVESISYPGLELRKVAGSC